MLLKRAFRVTRGARFSAARNEAMLPAATPTVPVTARYQTKQQKEPRASRVSLASLPRDDDADLTRAPTQALSIEPPTWRPAIRSRCQYRHPSPRRTAPRHPGSHSRPPCPSAPRLPRRRQLPRAPDRETEPERRPKRPAVHPGQTNRDRRNNFVLRAGKRHQHFYTLLVRSRLRELTDPRQPRYPRQ